LDLYLGKKHSTVKLYTDNNILDIRFK